MSPAKGDWGVELVPFVTDTDDAYALYATADDNGADGESLTEIFVPTGRRPTEEGRVQLNGKTQTGSPGLGSLLDWADIGRVLAAISES